MQPGSSPGPEALLIRGQFAYTRAKPKVRLAKIALWGVVVVVGAVVTLAVLYSLWPSMTCIVGLCGSPIGPPPHP